MESTKATIKKISKEDQKKINGGWNEYCFTLQGSWGICKTDARCDEDLPLCEPV
jgi:hypothetical protein